MSKIPSPRHMAKKSLGQNFLTEPNYVERIVNAVGPSPGDLVVEIGPGRGAITEKLLDSGAAVFAVELDDQLIAPLTERFGLHDNFHLAHQDALLVDFAKLIDEERSARGARSVKLAANLPYYISTAILQRLTEQREVFDLLVLMFQREVVERITAKPGTSERGYLTVLAEAAFEIEKLFDVSPDAFRPIPKVWSSVVRLVPKQKRPREEELRPLLSAAFSQKRKTISNNLRSAYVNYRSALEASGIDPKARAEQLTLDEWLKLNDAILASG